MKNEKLLHAIGKIDDELIHESAPKERKAKRPAWMKWSAIAACLAVVLAIAIPMLIERQGEVVPGDLAPMVFVEDTVYRQSPTQTSFAEIDGEFVYLGKIGSQIDPGKTPNEELQANHNILGAEIYQYRDGVVVLINEKYWLYEKMSK